MSNYETAIPSDVAEIEENEAPLDLQCEEREATLGTAQERTFALDGIC